MKEFSRLQTITFTSKVVVSKNGARQKHCSNIVGSDTRPI